MINDENVIPFRKRPPSDAELQAYERMTRHWTPEMRQLMFPEHFKHERKRDEG